MGEIIVPVAVDLTKFSEVDKAIAEMATNASMLKITDLASKEQFDKVHDTRMTLVKMRTQGIDKIEAEIKAPHLAFTKAVGEEASKRREQLKAIEKDLQAEEDKVNAEKERIRAEKARKAQEMVQLRIKMMSEVKGCVDIQVLSALSEAEFTQEYNSAHALYQEKLQAEEREKVRLAQEKIEQDAERERIRLEGIELQKQKDELAIAQKKIEDDKRALEAEKTIIEEQKKIPEPPAPPIPQTTSGPSTDREALILYVQNLQRVMKPAVTEEVAVRLLAQMDNTLWQALKLVSTY